MSWVTFLLSAVRFLFQYGPQIAALMKEIFDLIAKVRDGSTQQAMAGDASQAAAYFQRTGDRRPLLDLLRRVHDEAMLLKPVPPQPAA